MQFEDLQREEDQPPISADDQSGYSTAKASSQNSLHLFTKLAVAAGILAPLLFCIFYVSKYSINTPFRDDYRVLICLKQLIDGQTNLLNVLFTQHNEHRVGIAYLLLLSVFPITLYNTAMQVYLGVLFMIGSGALVLDKAWQKFKLAGVSSVALIPIAWLIFTPRQTLNLLFDIQVLLFMSVFFFIATLRLLEGVSKIGPRLGLALVTAFCSAFSCANGLLTLPLGTLLLAVKTWSEPGKTLAQKCSVLATWLLGSGTIVALYFHHFVHIPNREHITLAWLIAEKESLAQFFLAFLASPLANESLAAVSIGLAFSTMAIVALGTLLANRKQLRSDLLFPCMLILYAVTSAALASLGRVWLGLEAAYTSRYAGIANYGWVGLYLLLVFSRTLNKNVFTLLIGGLVSCLLVGTTTTYLIQRDEALLFRNTSLEAQNIARTYRYQGPVAMRAMTGGFDYNYIRSLLAFMERDKISVFQNKTPSLDHLQKYGDSPYWIIADRVNGQIYDGERAPWVNLTQSKEVTVQGWSGDVQSGQPSPAVLLSIDDVIDIPAASNLERQDIVQGTGKRSLLFCGFKGSFDTTFLSKGPHKVAAKILSPDGKGYFKSRRLLSINIL